MSDLEAKIDVLLMHFSDGGLTKEDFRRELVALCKAGPETEMFLTLPNGETVGTVTVRFVSAKPFARSP